MKTVIEEEFYGTVHITEESKGGFEVKIGIKRDDPEDTPDR